MMSKWASIVVSTLVLFGLAGCRGSEGPAPQWTTVGSASFSAGAATNISIALDPTGTPYVAFADGSTSPGGQLTVMKYTGTGATGWSPVGSAGSGDAVTHTSLAVDSNGVPSVGFVAAGQAYLMSYTNPNWGLVGVSPDPADYTSVAIEPGGKPCLAFCSAGYADVYLKISTTFSPYYTNYASTVTVSYTSLAFDSSGNACLAFRDAGTKVTVKKCLSASGWENAGSAGFSDGGAIDVSLAAGSSGTLYVAYQDGGTADKQASVMKYAGSAWAYLGSQGFSSGQASKTSIKVNAQGVPYVAYVDAGNGGKATVMYYTAASGWSAVGSGTVSSGAADFTALALDSSGTPYVAFQDGAGGKITVMAYK
jgi:hypothetical protein